MTFQKELENLINRKNQEKGSNTPDFLLAGFLCQVMDAANELVRNRESWYGRDNVGPGGKTESQKRAELAAEQSANIMADVRKYNDINDINLDSPDGRLLFAALAKLTTESQTDKEPGAVLRQCVDLAVKMYAEKETTEKLESFERSVSWDTNKNPYQAAELFQIKDIAKVALFPGMILQDKDIKGVIKVLKVDPQKDDILIELFEEGQDPVKDNYKLSRVLYWIGSGQIKILATPTTETAQEKSFDKTEIAANLVNLLASAFEPIKKQLQRRAEITRRAHRAGLLKDQIEEMDMAWDALEKKLDELEAAKPKRFADGGPITAKRDSNGESPENFNYWKANQETNEYIGTDEEEKAKAISEEYNRTRTTKAETEGFTIEPGMAFLAPFIGERWTIKEPRSDKHFNFLRITGTGEGKKDCAHFDWFESLAKTGQIIRDYAHEAEKQREGLTEDKRRSRPNNTKKPGFIPLLTQSAQKTRILYQIATTAKRPIWFFIGKTENECLNKM